MSAFRPVSKNTKFGGDLELLWDFRLSVSTVF